MIERASDVRESLSERGVTGAAADVLVRLGAPARHAARVEFVRNLGDDCDVVAWSVLDAVGVGGTAGLGGDATARHPALAGCGKGRKQASDGPAWTAAIRAAAELKRAGRRVRLAVETAEADEFVRLGVELLDPAWEGEDPTDDPRWDCGTAWASVDTNTDADPDNIAQVARSVYSAPWIIALAGVVLARITGVAPDLRADALAGVEVGGDAAAWAALYNAAHAAVAAQRAAMQDAAE